MLSPVYEVWDKLVMSVSDWCDCLQVAIKIIDTRKMKDEYQRANLHREARVMAILRHPNIVRLYETLKVHTALSLSLSLSVKVTKHSTIPYDMYLYFPSLIVRYSTSKNVVTLKSGSEVTQGYWKWHHSIDWVWFPISVLLFYRNSVRKTHSIFEIFDFKNAVILKTRLMLSRSLEMSPCDRAHRFWDIRLVIIPWPWNPG